MQGLEAAVGCRPTDTACTGGRKHGRGGGPTSTPGPAAGRSPVSLPQRRDRTGRAVGAQDRDDEGRGDEQSPLNSAAFKRGEKEPKAKYFDLRNST